jgi:DNA-binding IclR family transcriptional regulator
MDQKDYAPLHRGVAQKADAIVRAVANGHRRIAAIAAATHLPETTVIRVAALLREHGRIGVVRAGEVELVPAGPR